MARAQSRTIRSHCDRSQFRERPPEVPGLCQYENWSAAELCGSVKANQRVYLIERSPELSLSDWQGRGRCRIAGNARPRRLSAETSSLTAETRSSSSAQLTCKALLRCFSVQINRQPAICAATRCSTRISHEGSPGPRGETSKVVKSRPYDVDPTSSVSDYLSLRSHRGRRRRSKLPLLKRAPARPSMSRTCRVEPPALFETPL